VVFNQEWDENNRKIVQMALEERTREKIKNAFGGMNAYPKISNADAQEQVQRIGQ